MIRLSVILCFLAGLAQAAPLDEAKAAYESGHPEGAVERLESMEETPTSGSLQASLGAAWFKRGDIGRALFHFRQAANFRPRDADVRYNLSFVRKAAKDRLETSDSWFALPFSERETALASSWLSVLAGLLGMAWVVLRKPWAKVAALSVAGLAGLALVGALVTYATNRPFGVVSASEAAVRSGPGETYTHLFTLHPGAEFDRLGDSKGWSQIRLSDGKRGWIESKQVVF